MRRPTALIERVRRFCRSTDGATAVEYTLLLTMIGLFLVAVFGSGGAAEDLWEHFTDEAADAMCDARDC